MKNKSLLIIIGLVSIILFHIIINLIWLKMEIAPPMWDQAADALHSLEFYKPLKQLDIMGFLKVYLHYRPARAPLTFIVAAPFFGLLGFSVDAATISNFLYLIILVLAIYGIGRKLYGTGVGLLSAFVVSTIPIIAGLSREFLPDYALTAFVALSIYTLLESEYFSNRVASIALGVSCGLGMLAKIPFPLFFAAPLLYTVFLSFIIKKGRQARRTLLINMTIFAGVALLISGLYYIYNFMPWLSYLYSASYGGNIQKYWQGNYCNLKDFLHYSYIFFQDELSAFYSLLGIILLLPLLVYKTMWKFKNKIKNSALLLLKSPEIVLLLWAAIPYIVIACLRNRDPRINAACIAPLGILLSSWVFAVPGRWLKRCLVVFVIFVGSIQLIKASFGMEYPRRVPVKIKSIHWFLFPGHYAYCQPPETHTWQMEEIIHYIDQIESRAGRKEPGKYVNIGFIPDIPRFQTAALIYYLITLNLPYEAVKVAEFPDGQFRTDYCKYIITKTGDITIYSPWAVKYNKETMQILQDSENFVKLDKRFLLPDGSFAIIYKRVKGEVICP